MRVIFLHHSERETNPQGSLCRSFCVDAIPLPANHPSMPELSDFELMDQLRQGDPEALAALVRRHQQSLLNFFARLGAYIDAEDLTQDTFVRVFRYRFRYRPSAKFTTFLYTLARHARADHLRRMKKQETVFERVANETGDGSGIQPADAGARMDVGEAVDLLPEKLRLVVVLSVMQGLPYDEVGAILDIPVGTVKSRMFLALRQLREHFDVGEA